MKPDQENSVRVRRPGGGPPGGQKKAAGAAKARPDAERPMPVVPRRQRTSLQKKDGERRPKSFGKPSEPMPTSEDEHDAAEALFALAAVAAREESPEQEAPIQEKKRQARVKVKAKPTQQRDEERPIKRSRSPSVEKDVQYSSSEEEEEKAIQHVDKRAHIEMKENPEPKAAVKLEEAEKPKPAAANKVPASAPKPEADRAPASLPSTSMPWIQHLPPQMLNTMLQHGSMPPVGLPPGAWPPPAAAARPSQPVSVQAPPVAAAAAAVTRRPSFKRCASHVYIAQFIDHQQKSAQKSLSDINSGYAGKPSPFVFTMPGNAAARPVQQPGPSAGTLQEAFEQEKGRASAAVLAKQHQAAVSAVLAGGRGPAGLPVGLAIPSNLSPLQYAQLSAVLTQQQLQGGSLPFTFPAGAPFAAAPQGFHLGAAPRPGIQPGATPFFAPTLGIGLQQMAPATSAGLQLKAEADAVRMKAEVKRDDQATINALAGLSSAGAAIVPRGQITPSQVEFLAKQSMEQRKGAQPPARQLQPWNLGGLSADQVKALYGMNLGGAPRGLAGVPAKGDGVHPPAMMR